VTKEKKKVIRNLFLAEAAMASLHQQVVLKLVKTSSQKRIRSAASKGGNAVDAK